MSISRLCALSVLIVAVSASATVANENDLGFYQDGTRLASYATVASMSNQISGLEAELASLKKMEARLAAMESGDWGVQNASFGSGGGQKYGGCCDDCCWDWWTRPCSGVTAAAEIVWLRPQYTSPGTPNGSVYHDGSRFSLGYMSDLGRELRVRYFELSGQTAPGGYLTLDTTDFEYALRFNLGCNLAGDVSAGARYARIDDNTESQVVFEETIGPVVGLHLRSDSLFWNINGFGNLRYSHQFGTGNDGASTSPSSFSVTEVQLGLEWTRRTNIGTAFARGFFETQEWAGDFEDSDETIGLVGYGFGFGLTR